MSRRYSEPIAVQTQQDGSPVAFNWRGTLYRVRIIGRWKLATRWWDAGCHSDRTYYRVLTADHQVFEIYYDAAPTAKNAEGKRWVLDVCQD